MGNLSSHNLLWTITPPPSPNTQIQVKYSPMPLIDCGVNVPVNVSPAKATAIESESMATQVLGVYAHLDTGATVSAIDPKLAEMLNLRPMGMSNLKTAGGNVYTPNYVIDLLFPASSLSPFKHLPVTSCQLGFDPNAERNPRNFAMLLGRDVMSRWNIVWNGPESSVTIND